MSADELRPALERIRDLPPTVIATAVAGPPDEWAITQGERLALVKYLASRQAELAAQIYTALGTQ